MGMKKKSINKGTKRTKPQPVPPVSKEAFDDLLGKLLRTPPLPQSEIVTDKQKPRTVIGPH
jgi:hypothetical protein